ncbi:MAG: MotA/TolQ/ExbB proton channel family protein [Pseudomonadota bacterium]
MKALKSSLLGLLLLAPAAFAQTTPSGLDALLNQVRESAQQTSKINQEREARFVKNKAEQAALLSKAEAERAGVEARVAGVKGRFDANQRDIAALKQQLAGRSGDFVQVYAAARTAATDLRSVLADSYINAQYPARLEKLDAIAKNAALPSINQLEAFWFTLQQEMTEQGKSARFKAEVVDPLGAKSTVDVVRVGAFAAFSGRDYLVVPEGGTRLVALSRQPAGSDRSLAEDFSEATSGLAPILIDPTRGGLLALQVERPTFEERIHQGGWPGYVIIFVGVLGFVIAVYQLVYLLRADAGVKRQLKNPRDARDDNALGRVLQVFKNDVEKHDPEVLELRLSEAVLKETPAIERFQQFIRLVIAAGPLLGLLGTVAGMIETFQVITEAGSSDPKLMAGGISKAMIATVLGLGIAIPLLFINAILASRSRAIVQVLDEQSAGLLAERIESQQGVTPEGLARV